MSEPTTGELVAALLGWAAGDGTERADDLIDAASRLESQQTRIAAADRLEALEAELKVLREANPFLAQQVIEEKARVDTLRDENATLRAQLAEAQRRASLVGQDWYELQDERDRYKQKMEQYQGHLDIIFSARMDELNAIVAERRVAIDAAREAR